MKKRTLEILRRFDEVYGTDYTCYLVHDSPLQLLIATILSAQCTDARVNIVTEDLFKTYKSAQDFAAADLKELEKAIHSTGFYHNKAKNIIACAQKLVAEYGGEVPHSIEELTALPGVGRKTANVIRGNIFHEPSIVVDTHVKRISRRLGLALESDPVKIEFELMKVLPKDHWILYNIQLIAFGRQTCYARSPKCEVCFLTEFCSEYEEHMKKKSRKE
ncbi:MAG: endonuclease III [Lachnospiraceae bacterium]